MISHIDVISSILASIITVLAVFKPLSYRREVKLCKVEKLYITNYKNCALRIFRTIYGKRMTDKDLQLFIYNDFVSLNLDKYIEVRFLINKDQKGDQIFDCKYRFKKYFVIFGYVLVIIFCILSDIFIYNGIDNYLTSFKFDYKVIIMITLFIGVTSLLLLFIYLLRIVFQSKSILNKF